jgi:hypothetical protein
MKFQIVLALSISLFGACRISQKASPNEPLNETNSNQASTVNAVEEKRPKPVEPPPADVSKFSTVSLNQTARKGKFDLRIDVQYPQLKNAKTPAEIKFNRYVKKHVDAQILDFTNFLAEKEKGIKSKDKNEYEINLDYKVEYFSDGFASVLMNWNGFSGYLNMDYFPATINFDLKKGQAVGQKDLFAPESKYLEKLSELSREVLRRTCLSCGCGDNINAGDPLPEERIAEKPADSGNNNSAAIPLPNVGWYIGGTEPKTENFRNLSVTSAGLKITFGEYQVGPGCIGIIDITIPFEDLQPILRKDLNFN